PGGGGRGGTAGTQLARDRPIRLAQSELAGHTLAADLSPGAHSEPGAYSEPGAAVAGGPARRAVTLGGMESWVGPQVPELPGTVAPPALFDTARQRVAPTQPGPGGARMYVCGITPYDATHLGHAATMIAFD